ncbi:MAG TPA: N-6 DNA methylase [Gemmatimonadales bacterium]|nr:N-6 DNA methylase [Gemmatimonadales bacterium]
MGLESVLTSLKRLDDLPRLISALGHEARWEPAPEGAWQEGAWPERLVIRAALVGRAGELPWYGIEARDAPRAARAVARRLAGWGRTGGVLAIAPAARELAAAVAFGDIPHVACSLDAPEGLGLACLERLRRGPDDGGVRGALAAAAHAAEALAGEAVGRRFFRAFRATLERMAAALPAPCPAEDRHNLALLQLTRVLFLYLVQSKGWLDGQPDFLARQVDRCLSRGRRIERDLLRPLFFGTLNRPMAERSRLPRGFGRVPFLNGGLFEPHPLERHWPVALPSAIWRDAFDDLFERFRFAAGETGRPGVIAPDMLGRVFEGVMEPAARSRSGTFYTPAALVRSLVRAGLVALLAERLRCAAPRAERHLDERSSAARQALHHVTLLDPAVGSGAFLLGALDLLATLAAGDRSVWRARRRVLRRSLYGVDLNPAAVRLTELRLWLAVIADDPADAPERIEPLPNLDCLVRQGDSLIDPLGAGAGGAVTREASAALARLRHRLVAASGREKRELAREHRRAESRAFADSLTAAEARLAARIRRCIEEGRGCTLFGERRGLDTALRSELDGLRSERRALRLVRRRFEREGELPWFHYESHFADVFAAGGFDVVVGNPPWVRAERIAPEQRARLAARYRWWRSGVSRGFANRPDLSLAFVERSWELARPGGALALLVPAKLATAAYGTRARHALATSATLHAVADFTGRAEAAFEATVYPMALVATKSAPPPGHCVRAVLAAHEAPEAPQATLAGGAPWVLARGPDQAALQAIRAAHPRLGDRLGCHLGVKTGANAVFLNPRAPIEPELLRWAVRGRDLAPFRAGRHARLLWPCDQAGGALGALPCLAHAYLSAHEKRLRARTDYAGGPAWTLFRTAPATARCRIVWADLARRLTAAPLLAPDTEDQIPLNTCYVAPAPDPLATLAVAAWLNCTWVRAVARLGASAASGGFARFSAGVVAALPLPDAVLPDADLAALARDACTGRRIQGDIDDITARHLDLTPALRRALALVDGVGADDRR